MLRGLTAHGGRTCLGAFHEKPWRMQPRHKWNARPALQVIESTGAPVNKGGTAGLSGPWRGRWSGVLYTARNVKTKRSKAKQRNQGRAEKQGEALADGTEGR